LASNSSSDGGAPPDMTPPGPGGLDWNYTSAPVNSTPALWIVNYPASSPTDAIYFGTRAAAGNNFFKLSNLYLAAPTLVWSKAVAGGLDGSSVAFSVDGSKIYALSA